MSVRERERERKRERGSMAGWGYGEVSVSMGSSVRTALLAGKKKRRKERETRVDSSLSSLLSSGFPVFLSACLFFLSGVSFSCFFLLYPSFVLFSSNEDFSVSTEHLTDCP